MEPRITITPSNTIDSDRQRRILEERLGATVVVADGTADDAVISAARDADALVVGDARVDVDSEMIAELESVRVIGKCGIGVDNIDITAAKDAGIVVLNAPTYSIKEVSIHALTLILAALRKLTRYDDAVKNGEWDWRTGQPLRRVTGLTLGLSSFGKIARRVATKADSLGFEIVATDPYVDDSTIAGQDVEPVHFDALLDRADVVSVHTPLTPETEDLFDAAAFERMDDDAFLVNTSRGGVVDESDLHEALIDGELAGAALDVMAEEPPSDSPLLELDEVTVTPHVAWYSEASRRELSENVARDIVRIFEGEQPESAVDRDVDWL